jgi:hypothetical protein
MDNDEFVPHPTKGESPSPVFENLMMLLDFFPVSSTRLCRQFPLKVISTNASAT